ncbi:MAG: outer membrane beta-barrel protein [Micropepsaceae bacterium]
MRQSVIISITLWALLLGAPCAFANESDSDGGADVMTRARPDYDARGVRVGTFFLYPSLTGGFGYTSNVFNDANNLTDYFYSLAPQVRFQSEWARHALNLSADTKGFWYSNQVGENRNEWNLGADGRFDISRGTDIGANVHTGRQSEPRGTDLTGGLVPGDPAEPTQLSRTGFGAEFNSTFNRVRVSLGASLEQIDYDDTPRVQPFATAVINNDDRDRTVVDLSAKVAAEMTTDTAVFIRGRITDTDFTDELDDDGVNRDSSGWAFDAGLEFSMSHVLLGELFAGYTARSYDDATFVETSGLVFGAGLKWFPSMLTTVSVDAGRSIEDTSIQGASGYVSTRGNVGIDHELLRNVIVSGHLGYENAEYQDIARNDDTLRGGVSSRFLINNYMHFDAGWDFVDRSSSAPGFEYTTGQFSLSLTGKM